MLKQGLYQKLQQKLSPQQIQLMKLLQIPTVELEQRIKDELEINPALEEGSEDLNADLQEEFYEDGKMTEAEYEVDINDYYDNDELPTYRTELQSAPRTSEDEKAIPINSGVSFKELLENQVTYKVDSEEELTIAYQIIGNLDDDGYLRRDLLALSDDLAFNYNIYTDEKQIEQILFKIQSMEPRGIGARSLQECILIQLKDYEDQDKAHDLAITIVEDLFDAFIKKHYSKITAKLQIDEEELKEAIDIITKMNPKPGNSVSESNKPNLDVIPDFIVTEEDGDLKVELNSSNAPELKINRSYQEMLSAYKDGHQDKKSKEAVLFIKQKIDSAKWFIDAIEQRQNTLISTMRAIVKFQNQYFYTGDETHLRPMILKDIAEKIDMDISTVSRVANSKYVQTSFGTFLLKTFFSESLSTDSGDDVSTREVKKILSQAVEGEDKKRPLTDEKLASLLNDKGYHIARRTIAKYREQLQIPVARLRKEL